MTEFSSRITRERKVRPPRVVIHGPGGAGKTSLAASSKCALFLPTEEGAGHLTLSAFPQPEDFADVVSALSEVEDDLALKAGTRKFMDEYRTLVIDSVDKLEPMVWDHVCQTEGKANIEAFGYGKGYTLCDQHWISVFQSLDRIRAAGVTTIVIAHSAMVTVDNPIIGSYTKMSPKLHRRASAILVEWADLVGYLDIELVAVDKGGDLRKVRTARGGGSRRLWIEDNGAAVAKNRYGLSGAIDIPREQGFDALRTQIASALGIDNNNNSKKKGKK